MENETEYTDTKLIQCLNCNSKDIEIKLCDFELNIDGHVKFISADAFLCTQCNERYMDINMMQKLSKFYAEFKEEIKQKAQHAH